jgi:hydrogenase maturation protease
VSPRDALVVGVGNDLRGDDAVGLEVARRVRRAGPRGARVVESGGDGAALLDAWRGAGVVVLVDASRSGAPAGAIRRYDATAEPLPSVLAHRSTHAFGVAEAVEMARALGELPSRLVVIAIEGARFEVGAPMSPDVERAVERAGEAVMRELGALSDL